MGMPLIVAIEPDRRQAAQITALARNALKSDLVIADSTPAAIAALGSRVPDLILTSALLSPSDEAALADCLRTLDGAGAHVQTLTIPVLAPPARRASSKDDDGMLGRLRKPSRSKRHAPEGCEPKVFANQIREYLARAEEERALKAETAEIAETAEVVVSPDAGGAGLPGLRIEAPAPDTTFDAALAELAESFAAVAQQAEEIVAEPEPIEPPPAELIADEPQPEPDEPLDDARGEPLDDARGEADEPAGFELVEAAEPVALDGEDDFELYAFVEALDRLRPPVRLKPDTTAVRPASETRTLDLTMALSSHLLFVWPPIEGLPTAANRFEPLEVAAEECPIEAPAERFPIEATVQVQPAAVAAAPDAPRQEWSELLDALRREVEHLRHERMQPRPAGPAEPAPQEPVQPAPRKAKTPKSTTKPSREARRNASKEQVKPAAAAIAAVERKKARTPTPPQDEWGLFDPDQCGFAALVAKLEEITDESL
jgi:hypothetical protein